MINLTVPDISCGHCVKAVTEAITARDAAAAVNIDLAAKTVAVQSTLDAADVRQILTEAGYPPAA